MNNLDQFEERKKDHIKWALDSQTQNLASTDLGKIQLKHHALPDFNFSDVSLKTQILKHSFSSPHFVSSMTGGHEQGLKINSILASACETQGWLFCVGSQRKELDYAAKAQSEWLQIKEQFPKVQLLSNIGIEEVIQYPADQIVQLAQQIEAMGLIIHLNPLQELFQKKVANFKNAKSALALLIKKSKVPVVVKEVGFGLSPQLVRDLFKMGVSAVDLSGRGGTHWGKLEILRNSQMQDEFQDSLSAFDTWGYSNVEILLQTPTALLKKNVWASGGVRNGVDSAKYLALGAKAVGIAQPIMKWALQDLADSNEQLSNRNVLAGMKKLDFELRTALFCTGMLSSKSMSESRARGKKVWYESK